MNQLPFDQAVLARFDGIPRCMLIPPTLRLICTTIELGIAELFQILVIVRADYIRNPGLFNPLN